MATRSTKTKGSATPAKAKAGAKKPMARKRTSTAGSKPRSTRRSG